MSRDGTVEIPLLKKSRHATEVMKYQIFNLSDMVTNQEKELTGLCLSKKKRQSLQNNVAKIVFYDHGYSGVCGVTMVTTWIKDVNEGYKFGKMIRPLLGRHTGRISIMSQIEKNPGYIHELYRYRYVRIHFASSICISYTNILPL